MTPEELGEALREGEGDFLRRRRIVVGLNFISVFCLGLIALYQMGLLKKVPEPPGFDAEKVHGSAQGYSLLATPDSLLGIVSYAGTAALAAMGPPDRSESQPWVPLAMGAKTLLDGGLAAALLVAQPVKYRTFSFWAVLSALASLASVPIAWPEAVSALRRLQGRQPE
jgi:hypothetical protein